MIVEVHALNILSYPKSYNKSDLVLVFVDALAVWNMKHFKNY